ncbi:hypothetical protein, partial [Okeania hirsuta]
MQTRSEVRHPTLREAPKIDHFVKGHILHLSFYSCYYSNTFFFHPWYNPSQEGKMGRWGDQERFGNGAVMEHFFRPK